MKTSRKLLVFFNDLTERIWFFKQTVDDGKTLSMSAISFDIQSNFLYYYSIVNGGEIIVIGKKIIKFDYIESTNNYIKTNFSSLEEGTIIMSKMQTSGRGRSDHTWMSEVGNLYFSFLLDGRISRDKIFELLVKVSVAVVKTLKYFCVESEIKYPNDILIRDKKVCGILIESSGADEIDSVIVGVGINVNQINFKKLNGVATSMKTITAIEFDIEEVLNRFVVDYNSLEEVPFTELFDDYLRCSSIIGKRTNYDGIIYKIKGISEEGKLIIENYDETRQIRLNEIKIKDLF